MKRFEEKVAIVTGAAGGGAGGTGRCIAEKLAQDGAKVIIVDLAEEAGQQTAEVLKAKGYDVYFIKCDISNPEEVAKTVKQAVEIGGRLDILVNNAYIYDSTQVRLADLELSDWDKQFAINARGHFLFCKYAIPYLIAQPSSVIVNISSVASIAPEDKGTAYGASKAALSTMSGYIATQYGRDGLRCNAVVPGLILSVETEASIANDPGMQAFFSVYDQNILLNRHGNGWDVANLVAFLASDEASFITGQKLVVDGGMSAHASELATMRAMTAQIKDIDQ